MSETKMITKSADSNENYTKRDRAQIATFAKIQELIQRNVTKNVNKAYTQYAKDSIKQYLQNPNNNLDNIREVSRFLERNSTLYKKMLLYYASTPLFYYNLTQINDLSKKLNGKKMLKDYSTVAEQVHYFDIKKEMFNAIYCTVRDGMYVGFTYSDKNTFFMPLDIKYCRIFGKNVAGQWVTYFNAAFFDQGDNKMFVEGINGDTSGCWDKVFVDGYSAYKNQGRDFQWFKLPTERTFTMIAGSDDQFDVPLPLMVGLFISMLDLSDLESIIADKTELENYKLLVSKIPLMQSSNDVDDFAVSLDLVEKMQALIDSAVPELVGTAISPMELEVVDFNKSNTSEDTDKLAQSIQNLFNNAGVSQLVVAGGASSNSVGLKHALKNDASNIWVYVNREESWLNYYIENNISDGYVLHIHHVTWYNEEEYQTSMKDAATLGGSALDYLTSLGDTPYIAFQKLNFENSIGIKQLMIPLQSSYTQSSKDNASGAPTKDDGDLSESGVATRDGEKNEGTKANN